MTKNTHIKTIAKLGLPLVLGSILQILMNTMDMFFISRLGTQYAAASAMGTSIAGVIFVFSMLVSAGAISLIARKQGEKNQEDIIKYSGVTIGLAFIIGLILSFLTVLFSKQIIQIYDPKPEIASLIYDYLKIIFAFTFVVFLNSTLRSIIQATGDTKRPLYIFGLANILNIVLDYLFIVEFKMGIQGAALATVISQTIACLLMIKLIIKRIFKNNIVYFITCCYKHLNRSMDVLRIGMWACIQSVARPITGLIMMRIIYDAGQELGSAGFGIGLTIVNYFFIILTGLSGAVTILVGQKIGEKNVEEAQMIVREGIKLSFINFVIFFIPFVVFPKMLFLPFEATAEVAQIGADYLRIIYTSFIVLGYTFMYRGAFSGTGNTYEPMLAALLANVVCKVSFAYVAVNWFNSGLIGVWIAIALSVWVEFFVISKFYKSKRLYKL